MTVPEPQPAAKPTDEVIWAVNVLREHGIDGSAYENLMQLYQQRSRRAPRYRWIRTFDDWLEEERDTDD